jgi:hypothetical protein
MGSLGYDQVIFPEPWIGCGECTDEEDLNVCQALVSGRYSRSDLAVVTLPSIPHHPPPLFNTNAAAQPQRHKLLGSADSVGVQYGCARPSHFWQHCPAGHSWQKVSRLCPPGRKISQQSRTPKSQSAATPTARARSWTMANRVSFIVCCLWDV